MTDQPFMIQTPVRRAAVLLSIALTAAGAVLIWSGRPLVFMPGQGELSLIGINRWAGGLAGVGLLLAFGSALHAFFRGSMRALLALWTGWAMACVGLVTGFWTLVRDLTMIRQAVTAPGSGLSAAEADLLLGSLQLMPSAATLVALLSVVPVAVFIAGFRLGGRG